MKQIFNKKTLKNLSIFLFCFIFVFFLFFQNKFNTKKFLTVEQNNDNNNNNNDNNDDNNLNFNVFKDWLNGTNSKDKYDESEELRYLIKFLKKNNFNQNTEIFNFNDNEVILKLKNFNENGILQNNNLVVDKNWWSFQEILKLENDKEKINKLINNIIKKFFEKPENKKLIKDIKKYKNFFTKKVFNKYTLYEKIFLLIPQMFDSSFDKLLEKFNNYGIYIESSNISKFEKKLFLFIDWININFLNFKKKVEQFIKLIEFEKIYENQISKIKLLFNKKDFLISKYEKIFNIDGTFKKEIIDKLEIPNNSKNINIWNSYIENLKKILINEFNNKELEKKEIKYKKIFLQKIFVSIIISVLIIFIFLYIIIKNKYYLKFIRKIKYIFKN